jgi:hypothetical protein
MQDEQAKLKAADGRADSRALAAIVTKQARGATSQADKLE